MRFLELHGLDIDKLWKLLNLPFKMKTVALGNTEKAKK